ncbi:MAG: leucyl aminopeptidase family protein [Hyphomonadaceae bacterium]|nr:leucyl aminopeptidase family protein [Hyphomonadaceae bacterium]
MDPAFTVSASNPAQIHVFTAEDWKQDAPGGVLGTFAAASGFQGKAGQRVIAPREDGAIGDVLFGIGDGADALALAALSAQLPAGDYAIARLPEGFSAAWAAAGWHDGAYRFDRYRAAPSATPRLILPEEAADAALREAGAVRLLRDLVNTPAEDMGPDGIEAAIAELAKGHKADLKTVRGDDLLKQNYPMIHAVGRAGMRPPRIMELSWGDTKHPELALVGKGVAFDTGGLNIKTGDYMRLMKKDMGGAAHAIALARLVMEAKLPVRLKLYIPSVENNIAANAFRPGDVFATRKGLKVEIDNTDAEGRLILCDALARACESSPDLLIDFATLTGAARVAVGPDLAPFYTDQDDLADAMIAGSRASGEPVWRMPLWRPYKSMLSSAIADLSNSGGRMAGSITAAVYLAEFVDLANWVHFDIWAWREGKYGRPAGAAATGLRASWAMLQARYR